MFINKKEVKTIVFPVGGLGTRFLPATKAIPKEMLPVAEKPLIQYAFEEALNAGIEKFIFITGRNKNSIEDHFDNAFELQTVLKEKNKTEMITKTIGWLPKAGQVVFIRQQNPLGLGHAILCAEKFVGNEPFAISLADEMVYEDTNYLLRMLNYYNSMEEKSNIIGISEIKNIKDCKKYGMIGINKSNILNKNDFLEISSMVEKPEPKDCPSNFSIIGRYILQPEIFNIIKSINHSVNGEIQLTDAMQTLLKLQKFYGIKFTGERFDCGSVVGYLDANIHYALTNNSITNDVKKVIEKYFNKIN